MTPPNGMISRQLPSGPKNKLWGMGIFLLLILSACDRPFVEPRVPIIEIVAPSLDRLFFDSTVVISASASSFREIDRIERDGRLMTFDSANGVWVDTVRLQPGYNDFEIKAYDVEEVAGSQVVQLAHLRPQFTDDAPNLPAPWRLGGHTATLLRNGDLLVTGGSASTSQAAFQAAFLLPLNGVTFSRLSEDMLTARIGHTASLLPDGRVLILGGSNSAALSNASQLVSNVEVYDPATQLFRPIIVKGTPLKRAYHVTFVSPGSANPIIDIYGGRGLSDNINSELLVTRRDFRTFTLIGDTLQSLSADGEIIQDIGPAFGVANAEISPSSTREPGRYLITGTEFLESEQTSVNFTIDFGSAPIRIDLLPPHRIPRTFHSAVALEEGLLIFSGGFQGTQGTALNSSEIYLASAERFLVIDDRVPTRPQFLHTATKLPSQRILMLGGFSRTGEAISEAQYFTWGKQQ